MGLKVGKLAAGLGVQGRVGGNATDNAHIVCFTDLINICGIYEKFHDLKFPLGLIILWKL